MFVSFMMKCSLTVYSIKKQKKIQIFLFFTSHSSIKRALEEIKATSEDLAFLIQTLREPDKVGPEDCLCTGKSLGRC